MTFSGVTKALSVNSSTAHARCMCPGVLFRFLLSKDVYVVLRTQRDQLKSVKCVVIYVRRSVYLGISP